MNNTFVLHTGRESLEQEYAEYIKDRVGAQACTGLGELADISGCGTIIFVFRYADARLPEIVEDLFFERAGELTGKEIRLIGIGPSSDDFREKTEELIGMCGVSASCYFLKEAIRIFEEKVNGRDGRVLFVRELEPEGDEIWLEPEALTEEPAMVPEKAEEKAPEAARKEEAPEEEILPEVLPVELLLGGEASGEEAPAEPGKAAAEADEDAPEGEPLEEGTPETYMDEAALAEAVRAMMAESEETVNQVTDEVSAEFPDEEEAENEKPSAEPSERDEQNDDEESREDGGEIIGEDDREAAEEDPREAGGAVGDSLGDPYDDWDPAKSGRDDRKSGEIRIEEHHEERKEEPAGEVLPEEKAEKEPARDAVGAVSWELSSGETLKKYIRRANGEEPWPEEEMPAPEKEEDTRSRGYRFVDEPVTAPEEPSNEPPLGLKDLEAMEAEEAAEAVNRRERRKEREEREEEPENNIIARAAAMILSFFRGSREEDEALDFGDEEKESGSEAPKGKSFLNRIRDEVGVYDDEEEIPGVVAEPVGDYDEEDAEEFEDDADFFDSLEEDEDEEDF